MENTGSDEPGKTLITKERLLKGVELMIFDWSGVVSDDRPPVYEANMRVVEKHGIPREDFDGWLIRSKASAPAYFASRGLDGDHDTLMEEHRKALASARRDGIHPVVYPGAAEVLKALSSLGKKPFVISTHPENHIRNEAKEYGVEQYLAGISGEVKDKSIAIKEIVKKHGIKPESVLYLGDMIYDIQSAKQAGIVSVGITTGYHVRDRLAAEQPDLIIESLSELLTHM